MGTVDVDNGGVNRNFFCSYRVIFRKKSLWTRVEYNLLPYQYLMEIVRLWLKTFD